jgi:hypothetical protein
MLFRGGGTVLCLLLESMQNENRLNKTHRKNRPARAGYRHRQWL